MKLSFAGEEFLRDLWDEIATELREAGGGYNPPTDSDVNYHMSQLAQKLVKDYFSNRWEE